MLGYVEGTKKFKTQSSFVFRGIDQVLNTCQCVSGSMLDALHTLIHLILRNSVTKVLLFLLYRGINQSLELSDFPKVEVAQD